MALFRHIAPRQTGSLDLSHWWCDTRLWQWDLARSAAALVDIVYGLTSTPFDSSAWITKRSRWEPPLYDIFLSLRLLNGTSGISSLP